MSELSSGMTWQEVRDRLEKEELVVGFDLRNRRASKALRAGGRKEHRKYWRLSIQKSTEESMQMLYRKNLHFFKEEDGERTSYCPDEATLFAEKPSDAQLDRIVRSLAAKM